MYPWYCTHRSTWRSVFTCVCWTPKLWFINLIMCSRSQSVTLVALIKVMECRSRHKSQACSYTAFNYGFASLLGWPSLDAATFSVHLRKKKKKIGHFLLCNVVISCYAGVKSQSNQAPVGMTLTSTPVNSGGFIMMNAANIERMSPLPIDFQLCSSGKYDHPGRQMHMEL